MRYVLYVCGTLLVTALATMIIVGCSPDTEENEGAEEIMTNETSPILESGLDPGQAIPSEPEPDWTDSTMTITVGRFETRQEMFDEMARSFQIQRKAKVHITSEERTFTPPEEQYTVDITVLTLKEIGINLHSRGNITNITKHFKDRGYRPLTPEEAMELRLQLPDQPTTATQHKMSSFFVLTTKEASDLVNGWSRRSYLIFHTSLKSGVGFLERIAGITTVRGFGVWYHESGGPGEEFEFLYDPNDHDPFRLRPSTTKAIGITDWERIIEIDFGDPLETHPKTRFAAAVVGSERRK